MKKYFAALIVCLTVLVSSSAFAANILYFVDYYHANDYMGSALAASSHTVNTVADSATFATEIATGNYDLGIIMVQSNGSYNYSSAISALGAFVAGGGRSIFTDWSMNSDFEAMFGMTWTGSINLTPMTITNAALATGIVGDVNFIDPGWGTWTMGVSGTDLGAQFSATEGAIAIGNGGRSITNGFLTDTLADGAQGVQLYLNEIEYALNGEGPAPVPEPSTFLLLGLGLVGAVYLRRRS